MSAPLAITVNPRSFDQEPVAPQSPVRVVSDIGQAQGDDRQWIRALKLTIQGGTGELDLSEMRVRFRISDATTQAPRIADIRVSNLSEATAQRIPDGKSGAKVELQAGYQGNFGRIFRGEIVQKRIGRENPTDTFVDIFARTDERAYNRSVVNKTLKAGSTGKDVYDACLEAMKRFGIKEGEVAEALAKIKFPRPVVLFGMARDQLRTLSYSAGCTWNLRDGHLDVIAKDGARKGGALVLSSDTGLIGRPTQTDLGVIARCLLNPRIEINQRVRINERSIDRAVGSLSYARGEGGELDTAESNLAPISTNGVYRVLAMDDNGDTHGQPWYNELYLVATGEGQGVTVSQGRLFLEPN